MTRSVLTLSLQLMRYCSHHPHQMSPYRYQALEHSDSIRLLVLHPASDAATPIHCSLNHVRLSDQPKYEAVSYTWGDSTELYAISVDDTSEVEVRINCFNMMRHLRRTSHNRIVWIDAICIDQTNLPERSAQVKMMFEVYSDASSVVIYLGEETPGSRLVFEELVQAEQEHARVGGYWNLPALSHEVVEELDALIQRPWFQRVWTLQETNRNLWLYFMCGSARGSFSALNSCLHGYRTEHGEDVVTRTPGADGCFDRLHEDD
jgi:hypothetical protein